MSEHRDEHCSSVDILVWQAAKDRAAADNLFKLKNSWLRDLTDAQCYRAARSFPTMASATTRDNVLQALRYKLWKSMERKPMSSEAHFQNRARTHLGQIISDQKSELAARRTISLIGPDCDPCPGSVFIEPIVCQSPSLPIRLEEMERQIVEKLTPRERAIIEGRRSGKTDVQTARELDVDPKTIYNAQLGINVKLGLINEQAQERRRSKS